MNMTTKGADADHSSNRDADIVPMQYTILLDKFAVDTFLFEHVRDSFNDILPCLLESVEYTAEDLLGAELWTDLTCFAQRKAHLCLKHLATLQNTRLIDMASEKYGKTTFRIA